MGMAAPIFMVLRGCGGMGPLVENSYDFARSRVNLSPPQPASLVHRSWTLYIKI